MEAIVVVGDELCGCRPFLSYLLFVGEGWVDKLAVEDTGALGVRRQEPDYKGNL